MCTNTLVSGILLFLGVIQNFWLLPSILLLFFTDFSVMSREMGFIKTS